MKTVRVKIESSGAVKPMNEEYAIRLAGGMLNGKYYPGVNPKEYKILEPPKVEVLTLPPLQPEKKNVVDAEPEKQVITAEETKAEPTDEPRKPGRPKKAA